MRGCRPETTKLHGFDGKPGRSIRRFRAIVAVTAVVLLRVGAPLGHASAGTVLTAAGDIAHGGAPNHAQWATGRLVRSIHPRIALTLGDNQYPDGRLADFRASYDPTWGRFFRITRPVPGNHDYHVAGARGYFAYFGKRAHQRHGGYYSFDIGAWHLMAINSGVGVASGAQLTWVRRDLRRNKDRCELAFWHHPRWSSGLQHGSNTALDPLWRILFRAGVDVVLNGHEHNYERFAPMAPSGRRAPRLGIREFVVGTGGAAPYPFGVPIAHSKVRITDVHGVLKMSLRAHGYRFAFISVSGRVLDHGRGRCHS